MKHILRIANAARPPRPPAIPDVPSLAAKHANVIAHIEPNRKDNEHMTIENPYVALTLVALELDVPANELAAQLGDRVILDNIGMRVIARTLAADVIAEHQARAHAQRQRHEEFARKHSAYIAAQRAQLRARAHTTQQLLSVDPTLDPYALMVGADTAAQLERKGRRLDALFAGISEGHRISPPAKAKE